MTYQEQFDSALKCTTTDEAERWMKKEIKRYEEEWKIGLEQARKTILVNLGYMAGYYDDSVAKKIHELFGAVHPIFGTATYHTDVSPREAFDEGMKRAK